MLEVMDDSLEIGRVIAGKYRLEQILGEGGMGVVWAARELGTEARFALKFLRSNREGDAKSHARFVREARAAMAVAHPNVAKVHAVLDTASGQPFLVMDLLEGESLRDLLRRRPILGVTECARIFASIVSAVEAAHVLGIVHRDLKPENVFIVRGHDVRDRDLPSHVDGHRVRVLDFGIAKQLPVGDSTVSESLTSTGALVGTPHYMAPEQVFGDADLDGRADVWALGVMLYECLAGTRPIEGLGLGPILRRITVEPLPSLRERRPGLPPELLVLVDRMLARPREHRPTLTEIRAVLARAGTIDPAPSTEGGLVPTALHLAPLRRLPAAEPLRPSSTAGGIANKTEKTTGARRWPFVLVGFVSVGAIATLTVTRLQRSGPPHTPSATVSAPPPALPEAGPPPVTTIVTELVAPPVSASASSSRPPATAMATGTAAIATSSGEEERRAQRALEARDGAACLRACDAHDQLESNPAFRSTDPKSSMAATRAMCVMLSGDCEGGKALFRATRRARSPDSTPTAIEGSADGMAARMCTGASLSPRDELSRADERLEATLSGSRRAKPAECLEWIASVRRLAGTVAPRDPADTIGLARMRLMRSGAACLARAGDCAASYRVFREEHLQTRPASSDPDAREQDIRDEYSTLTTLVRACEGKP